MNIYLIRTTPSEFEGYAYMSDLTDEQLAKLGLSRDEKLDPEVEVCGEFRSVIEYGQIVISHLKVTVSRGMDYINLNPETDFNEDELITKLINRLDHNEVQDAQVSLMFDQMLDAYKESSK